MSKQSFVNWLQAGFLALGSPFLFAAGYLLSACFLLAALHKPFAPAAVGLWHRADEISLHLGFGMSAVPAAGRELLGWWLIPAGLLLGCAGVLATTRLAMAFLTWERSFWLVEVQQPQLGRRSMLWIRIHWAACLEVALVAALLTADRMHLVPGSNTPFLLLLAWISLRVRGRTFRSLGLVQPRSLTRAIALGIAAGFALECFSLIATEPLIAWATGISPDRSDLRPVVGSLPLLAVAMILNWTLAAFGEEIAWRGYVMNRLMDLRGSSNAKSSVLSLLVASALFGVAHGESQGLGGMLQESFAGFALGSLYFASGRNLALPIIAHGASNSLALVLIYFNRYPGL